MHETAKKYNDLSPEAADTILKDTYVDDILKSVPDINQAMNLIAKVEEILSKGGFKVKNWVVSGHHPQNLPHSPENVVILDTDEGSVLGLTWRPKEDVLVFKVNIPPVLNLSTLRRRGVLSVNSRVFDPAGLLAPFLLGGKVIMRKATVRNEDSPRGKQFWDEVVDAETATSCMKHVQDMNALSEIEFTRCLKPENSTENPSLVIFCDASEVAFGACAYIRWELLDGTLASHLVCAKNRLAPLKVIPVARLELNAAVIACRLRTALIKEMNFEFSRVFHITDSRIVQGQINNESHKLSPFAANRVTEVREISEPAEWFWTDSKNNVADLLTRPQGIHQINDYWKHGADYLKLQPDQWPVDQDLHQTDNLDLEIVQAHVNVCDASTVTNSICCIMKLNNFSRLEKLINSTAMLLTIIEKRSFSQAGELTPRMIQTAKSSWIKHIQIELGNDWQKRFKRLGPKEVDGIIVVGYRIEAFLKENWDSDTLILLPAKSHFSELVIKDAHSENHDGVDGTIARVRKEYWIPRLTRTATRIRNSCYQCRIRDKKLCNQLMAPLPAERLKPSPPFYYTALDLFGPKWIKDAVKKRVKMKCYGVIFTCLTTRAIYLDIACGYDTESFLLVLDRFINTRGCPRELRFDTGSQLTCAGKEWKDYVDNLDHSRISQFGAAQGMNWLVNKASDAPWRNGCAERLIRSVKRCLTLSIGATILTFDELQTVFFKCANTLNERPLGLKTKDSYFCPNDLILGRASTKVPAGKFDTDPNPRKRFLFVQSLAQQFWKRWHTYYFESLIIQQKWHTACRNLRVGDVVLVADSNSLRGDWKLAEVSEATPAQDGLVRDVEVRYKKLDDKLNYIGATDIKIRRPVQRLVLVVPVEEQ